MTSDALVSRIRRFLDYVRPSIGIYSLSQTPSIATWGSGDRSHLLCDRVKQVPLRVWAVGSLSSVRASVTEQDPRSRIEVQLHLMRGVDRQYQRLLLGLSSHQPSKHCIVSIILGSDRVSRQCRSEHACVRGNCNWVANWSCPRKHHCVVRVHSIG